METKEKAAPKVLFVEDDPLLCQLLADKLSASEMPFMFSYTGSDAMDTIRSYKPEVIMLDIMLPGKDGMEILSELKADPMLQTIPVIMFTNKSDEAEINKAKELGAVRYCIKASTDLNDVVGMIIAARDGTLEWKAV